MGLALFAQALNIRRNEAFKVFIIALLGFLWSFANSIGVRYADAYFLLHVGSEYLPLVYIVTACAMIIPSALLLKLVNFFTPKQVYCSILGVAAFFYGIVLLLVLGSDIEFNPWMWFFYRVFAYQMEAILMTGYWTFSDQFFNMQDAKRLFVLFSSTVFLGNATTGLMMSSGQFNFIALVLIILFLLACAAAITEFADKRFHILHDGEEEEAQENEHSKWNLFALLKEIAKNPLSKLIMLSNFLIFLMWVTAEYNYFTYFVEIFNVADADIVPLQEEKAPLTMFLGKIITLVSFTNLFFGFFLYSRLARSFGLTLLLFISPTIMISAFTGWLIYPTMLFPVMAYFVVEGSLDVIDDCNFNLLLNAVPKRLKYRVRIIIESCLEPLGMLIAGLLLKLFSPVGPLLTLSISLAVFAVAYAIKNNYHKAIYENLAANSIAFHRSLKTWIAFFEKREGADKLLLENLQAEHRKKKAQVMRLLFATSSTKMEEIVEMIKTLPESGQKILFEEIAIYKIPNDPSLTKFAKECLERGERSLASWGAYFLAANTLLETSTVEAFLQSDDPFMQSVAFAAILNAPLNHYSQKQKDNSKAELKFFLLSQNKEQILAAIRVFRITQIAEASHLTLPFLYHADVKIAKEAAKTLYRCFFHQDASIVKNLILYIKHSKNIDCRMWVIRTIAKLSDPSYLRKVILLADKLHRSEHRLIEQMVKQMGKQGALILLSISKNHSYPLSARALSAKILGHRFLHLLHANIEEIVMGELTKAKSLTEVLFRLDAGTNPLEKLFEKALLSALEHYVEFIIQILSYAGELEDPELVLRLWREKSGQVQSQLIETLEMTCEGKIFRKLQPLLEFSALYAEKEFKGVPYPLLPEKMEKQLKLSPLLSEQLAIAIYYYSKNDKRWKEALPSTLDLSLGLKEPLHER